jgi:hypothetical protein
MVVLVGITDHATQYFTLFIADYTVGTTIAVTNKQFFHCVVHSLFPSTLLTVNYFRWRPTIYRRLSALVASSLANYWLLSSPAGPPTLRRLSRLTALRWRRRQLRLLLCSEAGCSLTASGSRPDCKLTLHSEILVLKSAMANGIVDTYHNCLYMRWNGLVTGETSVVHSQCIAVGLFSE